MTCGRGRERVNQSDYFKRKNFTSSYKKEGSRSKISQKSVTYYFNGNLRLILVYKWNNTSKGIIIKDTLRKEKQSKDV